MSKILRFFRNIYIFRNVLTNHKGGTYECLMETIKTSLEIMENKLYINKNLSPKMNKKKLYRIHRALEILERIEDNEYLAIAESELGDLVYNGELPVTHEEMQHNMRVVKRASAIERNEWEELWDTLKGQDTERIKDFAEEFDGSGIHNWDD